MLRSTSSVHYFSYLVCVFKGTCALQCVLYMREVSDLELNPGAWSGLVQKLLLTTSTIAVVMYMYIHLKDTFIMDQWFQIPWVWQVLNLVSFTVYIK